MMFKDRTALVKMCDLIFSFNDPCRSNQCLTSVFAYILVCTFGKSEGCNAKPQAEKH